MTVTWYERAASDIRGILADTGTPWTFEVGCGVFAALSINQSYKGNLTLFRRWAQGERIGLGTARAEAHRAISGIPLNGRKVDNFRKALIGDKQAVVVDRWILRAYGFEEGLTRASQAKRDKMYTECERRIREEAIKLGKTPREHQADIWVNIRGKDA